MLTVNLDKILSGDEKLTRYQYEFMLEIVVAIQIGKLKLGVVHKPTKPMLKALYPEAFEKKHKKR